MPQRRLLAQNRVLERIATGSPLGGVLDEIVGMVEQQLPGALCSILVLQPDGLHLRMGAAPSLPEGYNRAIDGIAIGPAVGSCGTAAWRGETVVVTSIATDPLWRDFRALAVGHGLASCWSVPILARANGQTPTRVLGTFAVYQREESGPPPNASEAIESATHLAGLAIERENAIAELRASEERYRAILEHATDAIILHDENGIILDVNPQACRALGYRREEMIGKTPELFDASATPAVVREIIRRVRESEVVSFESTHRAKDGTLFPVEVRIRTFQLLGRTVNQTSTRDLTERRRFESQVRDAQKLEAIGLLAGGVAHDFNNLLTIINANCELLLESTPASDPRHEDVTAIRDAGERASRLTRQLLAFSRRAVVEPRVVQLNDTVRSMTAMLASLLGENIALRLELQPNLGAVRIDPGQLEQVLLNLAVNARDAMPRGGTFTLGTSMKEVAPDRTAGSWVCLTARDTGTGMTEDVRARAFEPFFTTKDPGQGTGLGLATVFGVVKQAGGHVTIETALGVGTAFEVVLPEAEPAPPRAADAVEVIRGGQETILIAEDDPQLRLLAERVLSRYGYRTVATASAAAAMAAAEEHQGPIDLLLTDVIMPGQGGRELAEWMRARRPGTRVLYMSGYTDDAVLRQGVSSAADRLLQKPFTPGVLARRVRQVLDDT